MPALAGVGVLGAGVIFAVVGDAVTGAAIAGLFSIINTVIGFVLVREQRHVRRTITAPRRLVYDATGNPIGTVLELNPPAAPAPTFAGGRRAEDEPVAPL